MRLGSPITSPSAGAFVHRDVLCRNDVRPAPKPYRFQLPHCEVRSGVFEDDLLQVAGTRSVGCLFQNAPYGSADLRAPGAVLPPANFRYLSGGIQPVLERERTYDRIAVALVVFEEGV